MLFKLKEFISERRAFSPSAFILVLLLVALPPARAQESFPAPPADRTLIYMTDGTGALVELPFETATTPLKIGEVAKGDKTSYIELRGAEGALKITETMPRFYLFVADEANVHPPFLVRLGKKGASRRVAAMSQKGFKGFAINSQEIVKPRYRVLGRSDGMLYMEVRPREPLEPGTSYAIIGTDLGRIASFEVGMPSR